MNLSTLQSKMKCDPEGYESELILVYNQFKSSLNILQQQAALSFTSVTGVAADPSVAKDLSERAMFLAHVTPFYAKHLCDKFPKQLVELLQSSARSLPSSLRCHLTQALILLINRKMVDIGDTLALFMELQALGDKNLKKLAFSHVVHSIRRMNLKHKNDAKNRSLQNVLFAMLQQEDEAKAKRSLVTLYELHRRKVWFDDRTANAICTACFHSSPRVMIAALSILIDYEKIEDGYDSDDSSSENDSAPQNPQVLISKQAIYKANQKGTLASKKKKKAKLQRAIRSMKRQQRVSSEKSNSNYYSPLYHLNDAQGFAEMLLARLQTHVGHKVKVMMLKVIARTIGLHRLVLLNFYACLQNYVQPHQRDVTILLAAAVQACHDMVPDYVIKPFLKQIVDWFVNDQSRPEAIAVGLNVVREICLRIPWLMTTEGGQDLLQDLVLYKKSHKKAVSTAARSLITLFREICPSLLVKKDRGRCTDPKTRPKAFGEVKVFSNIPGVELLLNDDDDDDDWDGDENDKESTIISSDDEHDHDDEVTASEDEQHQLSSNDGLVGISVCSDDSDDNNSTGEGDEDEDEEQGHGMDEHENADDLPKSVDPDAKYNGSRDNESKARKRKLIDFDGQIKAADTSLRAIKRLAAGTRIENASLDDGILSNEDFQRIKERKAKKVAKTALSQHGLLRKGIPDSDQLSVKRVDPANLTINVKNKLSKEEKLALVRAGRVDRGKYQARAAIKQNKTGGLSNRQKEHKKAMPLAAKRAKVAKSRIGKKKQQNLSGKQFRGRKAWK